MSIVDDILHRLDIVEGRLDVAGEATQPNLLTIDPITKLISATFSGKVSAKGIILPAYMGPGGGVPVGDSQILFRRTDNGDIIGIIQSQGNNGEQVRINALAVNDNSPADTSSISLNASDSTGTGHAGVLISQSNPLGIPKAAVSLIVENLLPLLLDQDGKSGYARLQDPFGTGRAQLFGSPMMAHVSASTQVMPGGAPVAITNAAGTTFTVDSDPEAHWNVDHFVCPVAGTYLVIASVQASTGTGFALATINGIGTGRFGSGGSGLSQCIQYIQANANDQIGLGWGFGSVNATPNGTTSYLHIMQVA